MDVEFLNGELLKIYSVIVIGEGDNSVICEV